MRNLILRIGQKTLLCKWKIDVFIYWNHYLWFLHLIRYNVSFLRVSHSTSEPVIWPVIGFRIYKYTNIQIYKYTNVQITITIFHLIRYNGTLLRISHFTSEPVIWPFVKWLDGICLKVLIQNVWNTLTVIWPVVKWLIVSRRVFPGFFIFWDNHYWWFFNGFVIWLDGICLKVLIQNVSHTLTVIWPVVKWLIVSRRDFPPTTELLLVWHQIYLLLVCTPISLALLVVDGIQSLP